MHFNRRHFLQIAGATALASTSRIKPALAQERVFHHAVSLYDNDVKYPTDFKFFDYVNPQAPKGGRFRLGALGSFDSLNPYTYKGDSASIAGNETLFVPASDEPNTDYGLVAHSLWFPEDRSRVAYRLRPEARFHDGKPMMVEDVIWSFDVLRQNRPDMNAYYHNVEKAEQTGDNEVTFIFSTKNNRELPKIVGQLPVLPKHWWTGTDAQGRPRDISKTTLEIPLGSGPYKGVEVKPGASTLIRRVPDYWGKDLPVNVGQNNFDEIETTYYRDRNVEFEAFKGDNFDLRQDATAKDWATGYNIAAVKEKKILREEIVLKIPNGMQGYVINLRREKFQDPRVRRALNLAFDFQWLNTNLFYGQYTRCRSYFNNSEFEALGLPSEAELTLLTPLKDELPPEVFTTEYTNPVSNSQQEYRQNLREAARLLSEAGWVVTQEKGKSLLKNAAGQPLTIEFLLNEPSFERITLPYQQKLELLGISVTVRTVDPAQYKRRIDDFDYDLITYRWPASNSPGNELRDFWGSVSANTMGGKNFCGVKSPAVDSLIDTLVNAQTRESLVVACRSLDRVLIWNHYVVPMWFHPQFNFAYWDRFGRPAKNPDYNFNFPDCWWWDAEKAARLKAG